jgi:hypothetical protein
MPGAVRPQQECDGGGEADEYEGGPAPHRLPPVPPECLGGDGSDWCNRKG